MNGSSTRTDARWEGSAAVDTGRPRLEQFDTTNIGPNNPQISLAPNITSATRLFISSKCIVWRAIAEYCVAYLPDLRVINEVR